MGLTHAEDLHVGGLIKKSMLHLYIRKTNLSVLMQFIIYRYRIDKKR